VKRIEQAASVPLLWQELVKGRVQEGNVVIRASKAGGKRAAVLAGAG
jgi:hypothetical protein